MCVCVFVEERFSTSSKLMLDSHSFFTTIFFFFDRFFSFFNGTKQMIFLLFKQIFFCIIFFLAWYDLVYIFTHNNLLCRSTKDVF